MAWPSDIARGAPSDAEGRLRTRRAGRPDELYAWIADAAGIATAEHYIQRIRRHCERLDIFPERGTKRDDIARGCGFSGSSGV